MATSIFSISKKANKVYAEQLSNQGLSTSIVPKEGVSSEDIRAYNREGQQILEGFIYGRDAHMDNLISFGIGMLDKLLPQRTIEELKAKAAKVDEEIAAIKAKSLKKQKEEALLEKIDRSLTFQLTGQVNAVPWELCPVSKNQLLGEVFQLGRTIKYEIRSDTREAVPRTIGDVIKVLIVSCEDKQLPNVLNEVQKIQNALYGMDNVEVDFINGPTLQMLKKELPRYDVLHFVGHAETHHEDIEKTGWKLKEGEWFTAADIDRMNADHPLPLLVFANACSSGQTLYSGKNEEEWDMKGMVVSFHKKGVRHFIGTLCRIPDDPVSTELAVAFYKNLTQKNSISQSLYKAKKAIAGSGVNGRSYAASYIHYGIPGSDLMGTTMESIANDASDHLGEIVNMVTEADSSRTKGETHKAKEILEQLRLELAQNDQLGQWLGPVIKEQDERLVREEQTLGTTRKQMKNNDPIREGDKIGPYEVVKALSKGPYRIVVSAISYSDDKTPESQVILNQTLNTNQEEIETQYREFTRLKQKLDHPGLIRIYDVCKEQGIFYTVHELAKGQPITEHYSLTAQNNPEQEICQLMMQAAEALGAAHERGIVHGELTPSDIFLDDDKKQVKILDVGLFKILQTTNKRYALKESYLKYSAPGQVLRKVAMTNSSADVWALGVILYELLTGHTPFPEKEEEQAESAPQFPVLANEHREGLSPEIIQLLNHIFTDPGKYPNAGTLAKALKNVLDKNTKAGGFRPDLELAIKAGCGILGIETIDEMEALDKLQAIAENSHTSLYTWSVTQGLVPGLPENTAPGQCRDQPEAAINWLLEQPNSTMLVLLDFSAFLDDSPLAYVDSQDGRENWEGWRLIPSQAAAHPANYENPDDQIDFWDDQTYGPHYNFTTDCICNQKTFSKGALIQLVKDTKVKLKKISQNGILHTIIILSDSSNIPEELHKYIRVFHPLPLSFTQIREMIEQYPVAQSLPLELLVKRFYWHAGGLTKTEVHYILEISMAQYGLLNEHCLEELKKYKEAIIRKEGLLELLHPTINLEQDVIGYEELKLWIKFTKKILDEAYLYPGMPLPKGIFIQGLAGSGKSYVAKAIAGTLEWPIVRLDFGSMFTGLLGASEHNLRVALHMAETISPVVLWIDDIDKSMSNTIVYGGSGGTSRLFNTLLTWLQERKGLVYLIVTARDITVLPVELTRAGRFDRLFSFGYLSNEEKVTLIQYAFEKAGRSTGHLDLYELAAQTNFYNNAEIVEAIHETMFVAAADNRLNPTQEEVLKELPRKKEVRLVRNDLDIINQDQQRGQEKPYQ